MGAQSASMMQTTPLDPLHVPGMSDIRARVQTQLDTPLAGPMTDEQMREMQDRTEARRRAAIEALGPRYVLANAQPLSLGGGQ